MKAVLLLYAVFALQDIAVSDDNGELANNIYYKKKTPLQSKIMIMNSRKYMKVIKPMKKMSNPTYTLFPTPANDRLFNSHFVFDQYLGSKRRVKKVLPDFSLKDNTNTTFVKDLTPSNIMPYLGRRYKRSVSIRNKSHKSPEREVKEKRSKKIRRKLNNLFKKQRRRQVKKKRVKRTQVKGKSENGPSQKKDLRNRKSRDARRLIASQDASTDDYPYTISIQKQGQHWCGGALLNQRLIITTANCFWKTKRISNMRIRAGSRSVSEGGQTARIQEVMRHPYWDIRRAPDYDIALALLDRNIRFSDKVHGVDLPNRVMLPPFEDAWVTSWGTTRRDGVYEQNKYRVPLQVIHVRLLDRVKCNNMTMRYGMTVSNNFICLSQTGKRAPCTRDTGAPAVSEGVLWGLASWGIRKMCGTERFPAMYSYTASQINMDFIINATHMLMSEERRDPFLDRF